MAPRDLNEPPALEPNLSAGGSNVEHIDNTNLANPSNPREFKDIAAAAGQKTGENTAGGAGNEAASSKPTVRVSGDLTGETTVTPETQLMDALYAINPQFSDYDFTRVDGSKASLDFPVKGDLNLIAKKKAAPPSTGNQQGGK